MQLPLNQIICADNVELLSQFPDECIDLTVTSPPYDNLRTYKGFNFDFEGVANQLYRVTKQGGVVVWVVADATINGSETGTSFKQALYFKEVGFNIHDTMIYAKNSYLYRSSNRYGDQFEYMFVLSKGRPKTFNPIMISCSTFGRKGIRLSSKDDYGAAPRYRGTVIAVKEKKTDHNIWIMCPSNTTYDHPAIFPKQLAHDHIISWSNEGDTVLDPFSGSGTTCEQAKETNRKYIGIDCSEEYCNIARKRLTYDMDIATDAEQLNSQDFEDLIV